MTDISPNKPLAGQAAFVAGGSTGINLGIAECLGRAGARVAILSRKQENVDAAVAGLTAKDIEAFGVAADVREYPKMEEAFAAVTAKWGPLDIVVSGAAGNFRVPAVGMSANAFKTVVDIDLIGTFNVFRASWDHLKRPGASLIAISAPQAEQVMPAQAHVCAAKAGVNMLTKCLAVEWGPAGVRVNAISPGPIAGTEGMRRLVTSPEIETAYKRRIPLRGFGTPDDIGGMAVFLCTPAARYINGAILPVDGGMLAGDGSADMLKVPPR
jgi:NAD(P)-dependent dehydrogenase (short-subunit alcohol dehydrogenase family)